MQSENILYEIKSVYIVGGTNLVPTAVVELMKKGQLTIGKSTGSDEPRAIMSSIDSITGLNPELLRIKTRGFDDCTEAYLVVKYRDFIYAATATKQNVATSVAEAYTEITNRISRQVEYDERIRHKPEQDFAFHLFGRGDGSYGRTVEVVTQAPSHVDMTILQRTIAAWYLELPGRETNDPKSPNVVIMGHRYKTKENVVGSSINVRARSPKAFSPRGSNVIRFGKRQIIRDPFAIELSDVIREAIFESTREL